MSANKQTSLMLHSVFAVCLVVFAWQRSNLAVAQSPELPSPIKSRLADRVVYVLAGKIATPEERAQLANGTLTISALANKYKQSQDFSDKLAHFWIRNLKIGAAFPILDLEDTQSPQKGKTLRELTAPSFNPALTRSIVFTTTAGCETPRYQLWFAGQTTQAAYDASAARCAAIPESQPTQLMQCNSDLALLKTRLTRSLNFQKQHDCACGTETSMKPWWSADTDVKVCPSLTSAPPLDGMGVVVAGANIDPCGAKLEKCLPIDNRMTPTSSSLVVADIPSSSTGFFTELISGFTLEPGMLIAKNIQEDRDYREVLKSQNTVLNGAMESYLKAPHGAAYRNQSAGKYTSKANPTAANYGENLTPRTTKTWRWVDRGPGNAGILTTPAFHFVTNGYRAKANRAYETFLCSQFVIPAGTKDTDPGEQDLTKRQPCAACHQHVEPLGNLFAKWPLEGTNFSYDASKSAKGGFKLSGSGEFVEGTDVATVGDAFAKDPRFAQCAVKKAFEFLVGRSPNEFEQSNFVPKLSDTLTKNGFKIWPIMLSILESSSFAGGSK